MSSMSLQFVLELVDKLTSPLKGVTSTFEALKRAANSVNGGGLDKLAQSARKANDELKNQHKLIEGITGKIAGLAAAYGDVKLAKAMWHAGADAKHVDIAMQTAGMSHSEIGDTHVAAALLTIQNQAFNQTQIEETIKEIRSIVGSATGAIEAMPDALKLALIGEAQNPGHGLDNLAILMKGAETQGATISPEKLHDLFDAMAKSKNVLGSTLRDEDWALGLKYAGTAGLHWDKEFITQYLPHFLQELRGSSAGTMFQSMSRAIEGGTLTSKSAKALLDLGMFDPNKVIQKGEKYDIQPGALKYGDEFMHNPVTYFMNRVIPALDAKKMPEAERASLIDQAFSNRLVARAVGLIDSQGDVIKKTARLLGENKGLEASNLLKDDPFIAIKSVMAQFENFMREAASPLMTPAISGLNLLADGLAHLTGLAHKLPGAATGLTLIVAALAGFTAYKGAKGLADMLTGSTSLQASAQGLDGAAVALKEAAVALGAKGSVGSNPMAPVENGPGKNAGALDLLWQYAIYQIGKDWIDSWFSLSDAAKSYRDQSFMQRLQSLWTNLGLPEGKPATVMDPGIYERAMRAEKDRNRDPEAARGRAMMRQPQPISVAPPNVVANQTFNVDVSSLAHLLIAEVKKMVDGAVQRGAQAGVAASTAALHDGTEMHGAH